MILVNRLLYEGKIVGYRLTYDCTEGSKTIDISKTLMKKIIHYTNKETRNRYLHYGKNLTLILQSNLFVTQEELHKNTTVLGYDDTIVKIDTIRGERDFINTLNLITTPVQNKQGVGLSNRAKFREYISKCEIKGYNDGFRYEVIAENRVKIVGYKDSPKRNTITLKDFVTDIKNLTFEDIQDKKSGIFEYAVSVRKVINESQIVNMGGIFNGLKTEYLDLSEFDTSKVTDMNNMFSNCYELKELNISNFNTSNVVDMCDMFFNCGELNNLDLSSFSTENLEILDAMFDGCNAEIKCNDERFKEEFKNRIREVSDNWGIITID